MTTKVVNVKTVSNFDVYIGRDKLLYHYGNPFPKKQQRRMFK